MACKVGINLESVVRSATEKVIDAIRANRGFEDVARVSSARANFNLAVDYLVQHRRECAECASKPITMLLAHRPKAAG